MKVGQGQRQHGDGPVSVSRVRGGFDITCEQAGQSASIMIGHYNAWRVFGMLAVLLGVNLPDNMEIEL